MVEFCEFLKHYLKSIHTNRLFLRWSNFALKSVRNPSQACHSILLIHLHRLNYFLESSLFHLEVVFCKVFLLSFVRLWISLFFQTHVFCKVHASSLSNMVRKLAFSSRSMHFFGFLLLRSQYFQVAFFLMFEVLQVNSLVEL